MSHMGRHVMGRVWEVGAAYGLGQQALRKT